MGNVFGGMRVEGKGGSFFGWQLNSTQKAKEAVKIASTLKFNPEILKRFFSSGDEVRGLINRLPEEILTSEVKINTKERLGIGCIHEQEWGQKRGTVKIGFILNSIAHNIDYWKRTTDYIRNRAEIEAGWHKDETDEFKRKYCKALVLSLPLSILGSTLLSIGIFGIHNETHPFINGLISIALFNFYQGVITLGASRHYKYVLESSGSVTNFNFIKEKYEAIKFFKELMSLTTSKA